MVPCQIWIMVLEDRKDRITNQRTYDMMDKQPLSILLIMHLFVALATYLEIYSLPFILIFWCVPMAFMMIPVILIMWLEHNFRVEYDFL